MIMANLFTFLNFLDDLAFDISPGKSENSIKIMDIEFSLFGEFDYLLNTIFWYTWKYVIKRDKQKMLLILNDFVKAILKINEEDKSEVVDINYLCDRLNIMINACKSEDYNFDNIKFADNYFFINFIFNNTYLLSEIFQINIITPNKVGGFLKMLNHQGLHILYLQDDNNNKIYQSNSVFNDIVLNTSNEVKTNAGLLEDYNDKVTYFYPDVKEKAPNVIFARIEANNEIHELFRNLYSIFILKEAMTEKQINDEHKYSVYLNLTSCFIRLDPSLAKFSKDKKSELQTQFKNSFYLTFVYFIKEYYNMLFKNQQFTLDDLKQEIQKSFGDSYAFYIDENDSTYIYENHKKDDIPSIVYITKEGRLYLKFKDK